MKNQNIIITGGLGFIGSHISEELAQNNQVTIIDNLSSGKINNLNQETQEKVKIIKEDLNTANLKKILENQDYIFHLAAAVSVPESVEKPIHTHINNVDATIKLLNAAKDSSIEKIIFSSSSAIYGNNPNTPLSETEPYSPTSPYAGTKAIDEIYLQTYYQTYGLKYTALRYFNVFGPKQDVNSPYAAVIPKFIHSILNNEKPKIYGDGEQTRDFIYIKDIVKANIQAGKSDYTGVVNIASGKAYTINQLYTIISEVLETDIKPEYLNPRPGDIKHSYASIKNIEKINFTVDESKFKENLKETVKWFEKTIP